MLPAAQRFEVRLAARELFGPDLDCSGDFIADLDLVMLKNAFRKRVRETHPDRAKALGKGEILLKKQFERVTRAYEVLSAALREKEELAAQIIEKQKSMKESREPAFEIRVEEIRQEPAAVEVETAGRKCTSCWKRMLIGGLVCTSVILGAFGFGKEALSPISQPIPKTLPVNAAGPSWEENLMMRLKESFPAYALYTEGVGTSRTVVVDLPDNLFMPGHYRTSKLARKALHKLMDQLEASGQSFAITVIGHSDRLPIRHLKQRNRVKSNLHLSRLRAYRAANYLRSLGVKNAALRTEGVSSHLRATRSLSVRVRPAATGFPAVACGLLRSFSGKEDPAHEKTGKNAVAIGSGQLPAVRDPRICGWANGAVPEGSLHNAPQCDKEKRHWDGFQLPA